MLDDLLEMISILDERVKQLDREIAQRAKTEDIPARLMTVPGIEPITATAIAALAPPAETFHKGHDFVAWLGLTPVQRSAGGRQKLGAVSKMGERTVRRLLIIGGSSLVQQGTRHGALPESWLACMLARHAARDRRAANKIGAL